MSSTAMAASGCARRCGDDALRWVLQAEQLGTGHAVDAGDAGRGDDALVLVLYGDVPLVRPRTLRRLIARRRRTLAVLTVRMQDPTGYGRIVRDRAGRVARIVEQKDANAKERAIDEVNTGLMAAPAQRLRQVAGRHDERQRAGRVLPDRRRRAGGQRTASRSRP